MNIAFFLTPKKEVVFEQLTNTMRQAIERMEYHRYTAIPILDDKGMYVGTLTEGDLLWKLKNTPRLDFKNTSKVIISDISLHVVNESVHIDTNIEDLIATSINQNFVPVVDDDNIFIGIIKRSDILNYCFEKLFKEKQISA
jgi:CBS domain-containing protein